MDTGYYSILLKDYQIKKWWVYRNILYPFMSIGLIEKSSVMKDQSIIYAKNQSFSIVL